MKEPWVVDEFESPVEKSQRRMALLFVSSIFMLSALIFGLLLFEKPPLTYKNIPFPVIGQTYHGGEIVMYRFNRCNCEKMAVAYAVKSRLRNVDGNYLMDLGTTQVIVEPGCTESISYTTRLPRGLAAGTYRLEGTSEVYGTVRLHIVQWQTADFMVLDP